MDWDFAKIFVGTMAMAAILVALLFWGALSMDSASCKTKAAQMGFPQSWGILQGYMVKVRSQWLPIENYKIIQ